LPASKVVVCGYAVVVALPRSINVRQNTAANNAGRQLWGGVAACGKVLQTGAFGSTVRCGGWYSSRGGQYRGIGMACYAYMRLRGKHKTVLRCSKPSQQNNVRHVQKCYQKAPNQARCRPRVCRWCACAAAVKPFKKGMFGIV